MIVKEDMKGMWESISGLMMWRIRLVDTYVMRSCKILVFRSSVPDEKKRSSL